MCFESFLPYLMLKRHLSTLLLFMVTTHIFLLLGPSFLKGHQIAKRCSHIHWIYHHRNKHRSCHPPGDPLGCPIKEVSEFVGKMNELESRNKRSSNHPSVIKPKGSNPASKWSQLPDGKLQLRASSLWAPSHLWVSSQPRDPSVVSGPNDSWAGSPASRPCTASLKARDWERPHRLQGLYLQSDSQRWKWRYLQ